MKTSIEIAKSLVRLAGGIVGDYYDEEMYNTFDEAIEDRLESARKEGKKYILAYMMEKDGKNLWRIQSCRDFKRDDHIQIKYGDYGGFVEKESNLSQNGDCWIESADPVVGDPDDSYVIGEASVSGNAYVDRSSRVSGRSPVYGNAVVTGSYIESSSIYGNSIISNSTLKNIRVHGDGDVISIEDSTIDGKDSEGNSDISYSIKNNMMESNESGTGIKTAKELVRIAKQILSERFNPGSSRFNKFMNEDGNVDDNEISTVNNKKGNVLYKTTTPWDRNWEIPYEEKRLSDEEFEERMKKFPVTGGMNIDQLNGKDLSSWSDDRKLAAINELLHRSLNMGFEVDYIFASIRMRDDREEAVDGKKTVWISVKSDKEKMTWDDLDTQISDEIMHGHTYNPCPGTADFSMNDDKRKYFNTVESLKLTGIIICEQDSDKTVKIKISHDFD